MIDYSIAIRKSHPGDENSTETKAYGVVQINKTLSIEQFNKHIEGMEASFRATSSRA